MKWIKRQLRNWINNDSDIVSIGLDDYSTCRVDAHGFKLKVYKANGGTIIETSSYNVRKDHVNSGLYVILDTQDIGTEIGKIITIEGLKT
jgi:hypothetical protein